MSKYGHLRKHAQLDGTAKYHFDALPNEPWLEVRPATTDNKPYLNAQINLQKRSRRSVGRSGIMSAAQLDRLRNEDRELYAKHVVVNWGNVVDDDGKTPKFSAKECFAFLTALPDHLFDDLRLFCGDPMSFLGVADDDGGEDAAGKA